MQQRRHGEEQAASLPVTERSQKPDSRGIGEMGTQGQHVEDWKWQRGIASHPLSGNSRKGHLPVGGWESGQTRELEHAS